MTTAALTPNLAHRSQRHRQRARTGNQGRAPVRAGSPGGADVPRHCRNMSYAERAEVCRMLDEWSEANRVAGVAPLTASTRWVLRAMLFKCMDWVSGRLDSSLSWIAHVSRRAYQTAVAAVAQLEELGVLKVQRRSRPGDDPNGPRWVQDTNLYAFEIPKKIADWWAQREGERAARRKARAPEDFDHAQEAALREGEAAERDWAEHVSSSAKDEAARRDLAAAQRARGPGAARQLAEAQARARARNVLAEPESNT